MAALMGALVGAVLSVLGNETIPQDPRARDLGFPNSVKPRLWASAFMRGALWPAACKQHVLRHLVPGAFKPRDPVPDLSLAVMGGQDPVDRTLWRGRWVSRAQGKPISHVHVCVLVCLWEMVTWSESCRR